MLNYYLAVSINIKSLAWNSLPSIGLLNDIEVATAPRERGPVHNLFLVFGGLGNPDLFLCLRVFKSGLFISI